MVEFGKKDVFCVTQRSPKPAGRPQPASTAVGAETFDEGLVPFQVADDIADPDAGGRAGKAHAAGGAAHAFEVTAGDEIEQDFREMMARDAEPLGERGRRLDFRRLGGQQHQGPQAEIGITRQGHDVRSIVQYRH